MPAVPGTVMGKGSGSGGLGSGSASLVPRDENDVELYQGKVPSIYKVAKWSEGHLISKGVLAVWEDAEQRGCY